MKNKIIFLNGIQNNKKISIIKSFQYLSKDCYYKLDMNITRDILPEKYLINKQIVDNLTDNFLDFIKILIQNQRNIIIDCVIDEINKLNYVADLFKKYDVYFINILDNQFECEKEFINVNSDLILNYTNNSIEDLANILYDFISTNKPKIFKKLYKENKIVLEIDENIKLETRTLKYTKIISNLINKNKEFFKKSLGWLPDGKYTEKDAKEYIKNSTYEENFIKDFVVKYKNEVVGVIDFHDIVNNEANIGYWLDEKMQGLGIMTKSCKKLIEYGFVQLHFSKINLLCNVENFKSENVAKRLNMNFECIIPNFENLYGRILDHKKYVIINREYKTTKAPFNKS